MGNKSNWADALFPGSPRMRIGDGLVTGHASASRPYGNIVQIVQYVGVKVCVCCVCVGVCVCMYVCVWVGGVGGGVCVCMCCVWCVCVCVCSRNADSPGIWGGEPRTATSTFTQLLSSERPLKFNITLRPQKP